ncbi:hypothetical protein TVAG_057090 [Trichomonas vaginalis G3]|uniref:Glycosyltransferase 61 catalytic domain-containing protein n=1 Tax=Trichomonas vaginalis (strain ATCC PRA-98 / G3) TaxID=412133 RepID=A2EKB7_TRIV3|nr:glycosyltransferase family [Trichomonas vaginalis G3]EAY06915.1 hypothetical protein TVAG_057090 [Trichomonas vaginalis G3]KAI5513920.1 glycosyltransferase family [Trichomonas vaginalis G3]|eukprot:XP_001319138.1 hypothetical protein [Trichomonas vaginalis G3]
MKRSEYYSKVRIRWLISLMLLGIMFINFFQTEPECSNLYFRRSNITFIEGVEYLNVSGSKIDIPNDYIIHKEKVIEYVPHDPNPLIIDSLTEQYYLSNHMNLTTLEEIIHFDEKLDGTWYCLKDLYANVYGSYTDGYSVLVPSQWNFRGTQMDLYAHGSGNVSDHYDSVIALGNFVVTYYGHWFFDVLAPLMMFPDEVIATSSIILGNTKPYVYETLYALGMKDSQFITIDQGDWIFAHKLYVVADPGPHVTHMGAALTKLSSKLLKAFNIKEKVPTKYVLTNRKSSYRRTIPNLAEIYYNIKKTYPQYDWIIIPDNFPTVKETARVWSDIKVLFTPTGSNLVRILFMMPGAVICDVQANYNDYAMEAIAICRHIKILVFAVPYTDHFTEKLDVSVEESMRMMKVVMYCAEHGDWPEKSAEYQY